MRYMKTVCKLCGHNTSHVGGCQNKYYPKGFPVDTCDCIEESTEFRND